MSLPKWIEIEISRSEPRSPNALLLKALSIAWEALRSAHINFGIPLSERTPVSQETIEAEYKRIDEAMRRIEELENEQKR